ncbi:MAG: antitoxin family protein [Patescibacteria group bacterium]|nr:antitoxin family protein [Patescibacteria group bacterium]
MSCVVEAIYEDGVLKPDRPLPLQEHENVQVTVEGPAAARHSILDIRPVGLGKVLQPPLPDDVPSTIAPRHQRPLSRKAAWGSF